MTTSQPPDSLINDDGVSSSDCGQACFDNRDSAALISIIFWILAIITGIFAFMDNGSQKKDPQ
ncbi:hypothetical protein B6I56_16840 [Klebsiella quasipneumoniae]|nr:hypothetical protein B6I56_16840 [Klebsiella quasipneumoniae]